MQWGETTTTLYPLITNLLSFSTTTLVSWTIAPHITGLLSYLLLGEVDFLVQVKNHLLTNRSLMETTGIVVGYTVDNKIRLQLASTQDPSLNFFGLPPPQRCGKCKGAVRLFFARAHIDRRNTWPNRAHAECIGPECGATTPMYVAPSWTTSLDTPHVFFWNLPLVGVEWTWLPKGVKNLQMVVLEDAEPL